jgi:hypothetical protein
MNEDRSGEIHAFKNEPEKVIQEIFHRFCGKGVEMLTQRAHNIIKFDELVKSPKVGFSVIPAKAGMTEIRLFRLFTRSSIVESRNTGKEVQTCQTTSSSARNATRNFQWP